jgi:hypothetical protein
MDVEAAGRPAEELAATDELGGTDETAASPEPTPAAAGARAKPASKRARGAAGDSV